MIPLLREFETSEKSRLLTVCDVLLRPLNLLFGGRKVILKGNVWQKEDKRVHSIALVILAALTCCLLSPLLLACLYIKKNSEEQRWLNQTYQFWKWQIHFYQNGYQLEKTDRADPSCFSVTVRKYGRVKAGESVPSSFTLKFSCYGMLKSSSFS